MPDILLVTGAAGQLATALAEAKPPAGCILATAGRRRADLTSLPSLEAVLGELDPRIVINTAAYTAVDRAERDSDAAFAVNAHGVASLAALCAARNTPLIHISTDYVFDGRKTSPYREDDTPGPLNVYGASKLAGEDALRACHPRHLILRTSWLYSASGANFFTTMLRLARERDEVAVVDDQRGSPTYAGDLARAIMVAAEGILAGEQLWGTYHVSANGETSWHGFAAEIFARAAARGLRTPQLKAISSAAYGAPAARPARSVLDTQRFANVFHHHMPDWREGLDSCFAAYDAAKLQRAMA
jgi:dTDP-4-dehydrorhamnose reductase